MCVLLPCPCLRVSCRVRREIRNHMFLRKVNKARMARLQRARAAGERAVECDLPAFEARSREATRTGTVV